MVDKYGYTTISVKPTTKKELDLWKDKGSTWDLFMRELLIEARGEDEEES